MKFPIVSKELIDALDEIFPDKAPDPASTDRKIWMDVGAVRVVQKLRQVFEEQNDNILNSEVIEDVLRQ